MRPAPSTPTSMPKPSRPSPTGPSVSASSQASKAPSRRWSRPGMVSAERDSSIEFQTLACSSTVG